MYGLARQPPSTQDDSLPASAFDSGETTPCLQLNGQFAACPFNGENTYVSTFAAAAFATAYAPTADLFAVSLRLDGPFVQSGITTCAVPSIAFVDPCRNRGEATVTRDVTQNWLNTSGDPVDPDYTGTAVGGPSVPIFHGLLLNPSPTWPTPDLEGNTYGQVLFEPGDLPASITATIYTEAAFGVTGAIVIWTIVPYEITVVPPRVAPFMCVL